MGPLYTGTSYVNWQLRIPASFWGVGWVRGEYGDAWKSTEWLVTVRTLDLLPTQVTTQEFGVEFIKSK